MCKIDKNKCLIINGVKQWCPYGDIARCGLWCPKCYIEDIMDSNYGGPVHKIGEQVVTCGQTVELQNENTN